MNRSEKQGALPHKNKLETDRHDRPDTGGRGPGGPPERAMELLRALAYIGARLARAGSDLRLRGPGLSSLPGGVLEAVKTRKPELLALLGESGTEVTAAELLGKSVAAPYKLVTDAAGRAEVVKALKGATRVALDLETTGLDPRTDRVRLLSLTTSEEGPAWLVDCFAVGPVPLWPALSSVNLVIHNALFDLAFLGRIGFTPKEDVRDTMLMAQLLAAGTLDKCGLAECCKRYLGRALDKAEQQSDWAGGLNAAQLAYAAKDVLTLHPLLKALRKEVKEAGLQEALAIETGALPATVWLRNSGVMINRGAWLKRAEAEEREAGRLEAELHEHAPPKPNDAKGEKKPTGRNRRGGLGLGPNPAGPGPANAKKQQGWNFDSHPQVVEMFALRGIDLPNTREETLAGVGHPLAELLCRYRAAKKRVTAYGRGWVDEHVDGDGRVRSDWRQIGTKTGRMAAGSPNLQNVPRDKAYRDCIVAPPGRVLVKADLSQIELRIAAKVSGDLAMIKAFTRGEDLHALTARRVTGKEKVTKEERQLAKALNFGLLYGMGADRLRDYAASSFGLGLTARDAGRYREAFFRAYPGLRAWHRRAGDGPAETRTLAGRRRLGVTSFTERLNSPVQGTGADGLKRALSLLWERRHEVPGAFPVLAVHDEIVVECDEDQSELVAAWLKKAMVDGMAELIDPVPVVVDVKVARTWGGDEE